MKEAKFGLGVYTVNSAEAVDQSLALGVQRITGDFPQQMVRHLSGKNAFPANDGVVISNSMNDVPGDDLRPESGEHVILTNAGNRNLDVSGSLLRDAANNIMHIGEGYKLKPGAELRVYPGPGTNKADALYLGSSSAVLNNGGDSLGLWNAQGKLMDSFAN